MKKTVYMFVSALLLLSCSTQKTLYSWDKYEVASYNYLKNSDDESLQKLIETYRQIIKKQKGIRGVVPPGVYADYGFVLLQANKAEEAKEMLLKEVSLYPESKIFIDRILKMIEQ
jgi:hypothetical protein